MQLVLHPQNFRTLGEYSKTTNFFQSIKFGDRLQMYK